MCVCCTFVNMVKVWSAAFPRWHLTQVHTHLSALALNKSHVPIKLLWCVWFSWSLCLLVYVLVEGVTASVCSIIGLFVCLFTCCVCTEWGSIPESCCQSLIDQDWRRTYTYTCTYAYMYRYRYRDMTSGLFHFMAFTCSSFFPPPFLFLILFTALFLATLFSSLNRQLSIFTSFYVSSLCFSASSLSDVSIALCFPSTSTVVCNR